MEICSDLVDKQLQILGTMKANKGGIKSHGDIVRITDGRQVGKEETEMKRNKSKMREINGAKLRILEKAKIDKHHLQVTEEKHKTGTCSDENQIKHVRCFSFSGDSQQLMELQMVMMNLILKLLQQGIVKNYFWEN